MAKPSVKPTNPARKRSKKPDVPKPESLREIRHVFRSRPRFDLSEAEVKEMLEKFSFFCTDEFGFDWANPAGRGIVHHFEVLPPGMIVVDRATGLMWQRAGSPEVYPFRKVGQYVRRTNRGGIFGLRKLAGYDDWRLPTLEEAMSLMQPEKTRSGFIAPFFDAHPPNIYTADENYVDGRVWMVSYAAGFCCLKSIQTFLHVRLVRNA